MAVFLRNLTPESVRILASYLYWAFCGVTLDDLTDASVVLSSNPDTLSHLVAGFLTSYRPPKDR